LNCLLGKRREDVASNKGEKTLQASSLFNCPVREKSSDQRIHGGGGISDQYKWRGWVGSWHKSKIKAHLSVS